MEVKITPQDQTGWVSLELDIPDELGSKIEKAALARGMSVECFCIHAIIDCLKSGDSPEQAEFWDTKLAETLRRNGCEASKGL